MNVSSLELSNSKYFSQPKLTITTFPSTILYVKLDRHSTDLSTYSNFQPNPSQTFIIIISTCGKIC